MKRANKNKNNSTGKLLNISCHTGGGYLPPEVADRMNNRMMRRMRGERKGKKI